MACTTSALPRMAVGAPSLSTRFGPLTVTSMRARPFLSALALGRSPRCRALDFGPPCGSMVGLKCAPALAKSGSEQTPFSCTWKPTSLPGSRPVISPSMETASPSLLTVRTPLTVLPDAEMRVTCTGPGADAGAALAAGALRAGSAGAGAGLAGDGAGVDVSTEGVAATGATDSCFLPQAVQTASGIRSASASVFMGLSVSACVSSTMDEEGITRHQRARDACVVGFLRDESIDPVPVPHLSAPHKSRSQLPSGLILWQNGSCGPAAREIAPDQIVVSVRHANMRRRCTRAGYGLNQKKGVRIRCVRGTKPDSHPFRN